MISLLTYPDISYTGIRIVLLESTPNLQHWVTTHAADLKLDTNLVIYDLRLQDQLDYALLVLNTSDLIFYDHPKLTHWLSAYVLAKSQCYYIETDSNTVNTIYKISLRQVDERSITGVLDNAVQKRSHPTL